MVGRALGRDVLLGIEDVLHIPSRKACLVYERSRICCLSSVLHHPTNLWQMNNYFNYL